MDEPAEDVQQVQRRKLEEAQKRAEQEAAVKGMLRQVMETPAYERLQNIRLSNPELYGQLVKLLAYLVQQGQLKGKVSEEQLKALVAKILSQRKETTIRFARK